MKFSLTQAQPFDSLNVRGNAYNTAADHDAMSASVMTVNGWHGMVKLAAARCFYVLEGEGLFVVDGRQQEVAASDVVIVPELVPHDFTGDMKLLVVHSPAYAKEREKKLE